MQALIGSVVRWKITLKQVVAIAHIARLKSAMCLCAFSFDRASKSAVNGVAKRFAIWHFRAVS